MAKYAALADAILGATTIRQVRQSDHKTGQEIRKPMNSGGAAVVQVSGKKSVPVSSFTTEDLAGLLGLNTSTILSAGYAVAAGTITLPYKLRATGALFASGSTHPALTGANALIIVTSVDATEEGDAASAQVEVHWTSTDGITNPCTLVASQALASQAFNAEYTLGPSYINATLLAGVQGIKVTPGIEVAKPPLGSGSIYPAWASIKEVIPTLEITVNDFATIETTVGAFTAMTSANIYLKKRADSGTFTAAATAEHIRLTFAAGLTDTGSVSASQNDDGSGTITLHGKTMTCSVVAALP